MLVPIADLFFRPFYRQGDQLVIDGRQAFRVPAGAVAVPTAWGWAACRYVDDARHVIDS